VPPTVFFKLKKHRINSEREEEKTDNKLTQSSLRLKMPLENRIFAAHFTLYPEKQAFSTNRKYNLSKRQKPYGHKKKRFGNYFPNLFHFIWSE
jgi:transposase